MFHRLDPPAPADPCLVGRTSKDAACRDRLPRIAKGSFLSQRMPEWRRQVTAFGFGKKFSSPGDRRADGSRPIMTSCSKTKASEEVNGKTPVRSNVRSHSQPS